MPIIIVKQLNGAYSEDVLDAAISFILNIDTMATLSVYFIPKTLVARKETLRTHNRTLGVIPVSIRKTMDNICNHSASYT